MRLGQAGEYCRGSGHSCRGPQWAAGGGGDLPVGLHTACLGTLAFSGFFLSTWSCWNISENFDSYLKGKSLAVELLEETRRNILVCSPEQFSSRSSPLLASACCWAACQVGLAMQTPRPRDPVGGPIQLEAPGGHTCAPGPPTHADG